MIRTALVLLLAIVLGTVHAQIAPATYLIRFTDKANTPYSIDLPQEFLGQRAIERRARQNIPIDELDLPVDPVYISTLLNAGQFELHTVSKWFNAITIRSTDTLALDSIASLPFVAEVRALCSTIPYVPRLTDKFKRTKNKVALNDLDGTYGASLRGISMMNGHLLHEMGGARGEDMLIGVLDSGFDRADSMAAFAHLYARDGVKLTDDIVCGNCNVYSEHWHGRSVLSVLAGQLPGKLMGTAPHADYVLLRTEDVHSEYPVEEDNWIRGAEIADSIGCDVLNTSLGYTQFDDSTMDHTWADLDGLTARISIAAGIAARKGMIPVVSAGNSGAAAWHRIGTPADALDILAVGAVDNDRHITDFSSRGPSADGRVKPDVCAVGLGAVGVNDDGDDIEAINGTSFASPLVCGLVACLWQLHREKDAHTIMDAVRRSASTANAPNDSLGFGIPDLWRAHLLLGGTDLTGLHAPTFFQVHPLPFSSALNIDLFTGDADHLGIDMRDAEGRSVLSRTVALEPNVYQQLRIADAGLAALPNGIYVLHADLAGRAELVRKLVKAP